MGGFGLWEHPDVGRSGALSRGPDSQFRVQGAVCGVWAHKPETLSPHP